MVVKIVVDHITKIVVAFKNSSRKSSNAKIDLILLIVVETEAALK